MANKDLWDKIGKDISSGAEGCRDDDPGYCTDTPLLRYKRWRECYVLKNLAHKLGLKRIGNFLEIGCGTGTNLILMNQQGVTVAGCDISPALLKIADKRLRGQGFNVPLALTDGKNLPFKPQSIGCILIVKVLCHNPAGKDFDKLLDDISVIASGDGLVILGEDIRSVRMEKPDYICRTKQDYLDIFRRNNFRLVTYKCIDSWTPVLARRRVYKIFHSINIFRGIKNLSKPTRKTAENGCESGGGTKSDFLSDSLKNTLIEIVSLVISILLSIFHRMDKDGIGIFVFRKIK